MSTNIVDDSVIVPVTNMVSHTVALQLSNGLFRRFAPNATMNIAAGELRQASYNHGNLIIFQNFLRVGNKDLAEEFGIDSDEVIEYNWSTNDIIKCLQEGSLEELLDALDFAPEGIVQEIVDKAVELEISDERKRKAIKDKTGADISVMISNSHVYDNQDENTDNKPTQRRAAKKTTTSTTRRAKKTTTTTKKTAAAAEETATAAE